MNFLKNLRSEHVIALLAILVGYLAVGLVAFWLFWPYKTLVIENEQAGGVPVITTTLHPGDPLQYYLNYCKYVDLTSTVYRTLVDGQIITLQTSQGTLPIGCDNNHIVSTVSVPETINPGRYYLSVSVDYKVNPIRTVRTTYRTQYFDVVAKPQSGTAVINGTPTRVIIHPNPIATTTASSSSGS